MNKIRLNKKTTIICILFHLFTFDDLFIILKLASMSSSIYKRIVKKKIKKKNNNQIIWNFFT